MQVWELGSHVVLGGFVAFRSQVAITVGHGARRPNPYISFHEYADTDTDIWMLLIDILLHRTHSQLDFLTHPAHRS